MRHGYTSYQPQKCGAVQLSLISFHKITTYEFIQVLYNIFIILAFTMNRALTTILYSIFPFVYLRFPCFNTLCKGVWLDKAQKTRGPGWVMTTDTRNNLAATPCGPLTEY